MFRLGGQAKWSGPDNRSCGQRLGYIRLWWAGSLDIQQRRDCLEFRFECVLAGQIGDNHNWSLGKEGVG